MARLKPYTENVLGQIIQFPIIVDSKGSFHTEYPPIVMKVSKKYGQKHATRDSLVDEIREIVKEVNEAQTTYEDWIYYGIKRTYRAHLNEGGGLQIAFVAVRTKTTGADVKHNVINWTPFSRSEGEQDNGLPPNFQLLTNEYRTAGSDAITLDPGKRVVFSADAYDFFKSITKAIDQLFGKLNDFLQPDQILQLVADKQLPELFNQQNAKQQ